MIITYFFWIRRMVKRWTKSQRCHTLKYGGSILIKESKNRSWSAKIASLIPWKFAKGYPAELRLFDSVADPLKKVKRTWKGTVGGLLNKRSSISPTCTVVHSVTQWLFSFFIFLSSDEQPQFDSVLVELRLFDMYPYWTLVFDGW